MCIKRAYVFLAYLFVTSLNVYDLRRVQCLYTELIVHRAYRKLIATYHYPRVAPSFWCRGREACGPEPALNLNQRSQDEIRSRGSLLLGAGLQPSAVGLVGQGLFPARRHSALRNLGNLLTQAHLEQSSAPPTPPCLPTPCFQCCFGPVESNFVSRSVPDSF